MSNIIQLRTRDTYHAHTKDTDATVLKDIFGWYAEYSITEEQIERVLDPVIKMIHDGKFDKHRPSRFTGIFKMIF